MKKNKQKVLGVITARGGSKGIPRKNIKELSGKPLIAWTIDAAKNATTLSDCIVSTDDTEIAAVARACGATVPFMRPAELAKNTTSHLPVIQHALLEMEKQNGVTYDSVVILQPTSPFRKAKYIDEVVNMLYKSDADSAVSVYEVDSGFHPTKMKVFSKDGSLESFCSCAAETQGARRQDIPSVYKRSGDVYAMTRECIIDKDSLYGDKTVASIVPSDWVVDIDEPKDWNHAEALAEKWFSEQ